MPRSSAIAGEVLAIMRRRARHCWTLDDLQDDLAFKGLTPNPSSVFRAVSGLEREGAVVRVPLGDGRGHYELTAEHHDHLVCDVCGRIEPLTCSIVDQLASDVRAWSGFRMSDHQLVLTGTCAPCAGDDGSTAHRTGRSASAGRPERSTRRPT